MSHGEFEGVKQMIDKVMVLVETRFFFLPVASLPLSDTVL